MKFLLNTRPNTGLNTRPNAGLNTRPNTGPNTRPNRGHLRFPTLLLVLSIATVAAPAAAPQADRWVGTWASAPTSANNGRATTLTAAPPMLAPPSNATLPNIIGAPEWKPAPNAAPVVAPPPVPAPGRPAPFVYGSEDATLREIVHVSIGGAQIRVVFTNEFGIDPLTIGAAHVAVSQGGSTVNLVSAAGLTFNGRTQVTIPPGALMVSDAADLNLPAGSDLAISFFLPAQTIHQLSQHGGAEQTSYTAPGNVVGAKTLDTPSEIHSWPFIKAVDVKAPAHAGAVVAIGDSITDGAFITRSSNNRWPDELARRLVANPKTADLGVLNLGISGNRVLHDNAGPSALARFDRDVLAQAGVKYVIVLEAINDIGQAYDPRRPRDVVTADDLIGGYLQMAERAHLRGLKIYFATLTPYTGAGSMSPAGEAVRQALNNWIRTTKEIDGVIDFDKITRDPANPAMFLPAYDHGDHLHPGDTGYKAMGDAIDLNLFLDKK